MFGFEHERSYICAFKKHLGLTPGEFLRPMNGLPPDLTADAIPRYKYLVYTSAVFTPGT